jgi:hypothetical protein
MSRQARPEHLVLVSLTIGAAGYAAAALYRTVVPLVTRDVEAPVAPLTDSVRAELEREKLLTLRAIKELEFDRAMGKMSAADFDEMAGRLRARAMFLMRRLDAGSGGYREVIERELEARVSRERGAAGAPRPGGQAAPDRPAAVTCACGAANDSDAAFCKRCGARLSPAGAEA